MYLEGATIPGYVLRAPSGDRASVQAAGKWKDGFWTVEFRRAYSGTEHDFQVVPGDSVTFAHEIFDDIGSGHAENGVDSTIYTLDFSGIPAATASQPMPAGVPESFILDQNYPNPFNPSTRIAFLLSSPSNVELTVFDILGREVETVLRRNLPAGVHQVDFNASDLPSGVYVYAVTAGQTVQTRTMTLVR
ncbi:MAG: hypothetical protein ACI84D_001252 [Thalassolituus oleivorans]|jgi:hypothetical protein